MVKYDKYDFPQELNTSAHKTIVQKLEQQYEKPLIEWTTEDIDDFLYDYNSTSQNALATNLSHLRAIHQYICKQEKVKVIHLKASKEIDMFINPTLLKMETISAEEFKEIRDTWINKEEGINFRDRVIFELAWEGLTTTEICGIKRKGNIHIEYDNVKLPKHIIIELDGRNPRKVIIDELSHVNDIIGCLKEHTHFSNNEDGGVPQNYPYRESPYLIRTTIAGGKSKSDTKKIATSQADFALKNGLERIRYNKKDLQRLCIESVRKSRIFWEITRKGTAKNANEIIKLKELPLNFASFNPTTFRYCQNNSEIFYGIDSVKRRRYEKTRNQEMSTRIMSYSPQVIFSEEDDLQFQNSILLVDPKITTPEVPVLPPEKQVGKGRGWSRNPKMSKEAILISRFLCEFDYTHMTFLSKVTAKNFVEAHHIIPLGLQKEFRFCSLDVPGNIASLCPICHRAIHHGEDDIKLKILNKIYFTHAKRLERFGIEIDFDVLCNIYKNDRRA